MTWTMLLGFGWCGFGWDGGLVPEVRCGLLRVAWCRGWPFEKYREALDAALRGMGA